MLMIQCFNPISYSLHSLLLISQQFKVPKQKFCHLNSRLTYAISLQILQLSRNGEIKFSCKQVNLAQSEATVRLVKTFSGQIISIKLRANRRKPKVLLAEPQKSHDNSHACPHK